jgi:two-component system, NarL family, response regulator DegU
MTKVALLVNDVLIRKSLLSLLNSFKGIKVDMDTDCIKQIMNARSVDELDVIIVKTKQIDHQTIQNCSQLKNAMPKAKVIILANEMNGQHISQLIEVGVKGCFSNNVDPEILKEAILTNKDDRFKYDSEVARYIQDAFLNNLESKRSKDKIILTERELQVIKLACDGLNSSEIASELFINVRTVETHRKRIISKTQAKNFIGVILYALKNNILTVEELA